MFFIFFCILTDVKSEFLSSTQIYHHKQSTPHFWTATLTMTITVVRPGEIIPARVSILNPALAALPMNDSLLVLSTQQLLLSITHLTPKD